jgi:hypothetical protein
LNALSLPFVSFIPPFSFNYFFCSFEWMIFHLLSTLNLFFLLSFLLWFTAFIPCFFLFLSVFYFSIGGIKYNQINHYLIDWFGKIHPFLKILVIHLTPFGAHWCKIRFWIKWLVSNGGFPIFDTPQWSLSFLSLIWFLWGLISEVVIFLSLQGLYVHANNSQDPQR